MLKKLLHVSPSDELRIMSTPPGWIRIDGLSFTIYLATYDGQYPDIGGIVRGILANRDCATATLSAKVLSPILRLADAMTTTYGGESLRMEIGKGELQLQLASPHNELHDTLPAETVGSAHVCVLPRSLAQAVSAAPDNMITLRVWEPSKPFVIETDNWTVLQAPVVDHVAVEDSDERPSPPPEYEEDSDF